MPTSSDPPAHLLRARETLAGQRALVLGLAREGVDLARFLTGHGARVVASDRKPREQLAPELAQIDGLPVEIRAGGEPRPEWLAEIDVVYASPGIPPEHPLLVASKSAGVRVSSLVELFFELCPSRVVGITGSAGKTTTTSLVGEIFKAAGRDVFVGGNIGRPLLGELHAMTSTSWVVLELSSFQLEFLRQSPHIGVVTNVTPNHLDRHASMEDYWEAKGQILRHQGSDDWAVLNADDSWSARYTPRGRVLRFSLERQADAWLDGDTLVLGADPLLAASQVPVPGRHNLANVLTASLAAQAAGIERSAMVEAIRAFQGVPHRLQVVHEQDGVRYVDDSIATAPERSIAALKALNEPVVLIAGGKDKHLPMDEWARLIARRARHVVLLGEMSGLVAEALARLDPPYTLTSQARDMTEAVRLATRAAREGDVVLLSPGGTSYDMYRDFEERGADFARAAAALSAGASSSRRGVSRDRPAHPSTSPSTGSGQASGRTGSRLTVRAEPVEARPQGPKSGTPS